MSESTESWKSVTLDSLLPPGGIFDGPFGSNLKTADYTESGVRVIRLENLANLRFIEEKRTYISEEKYESLKKHTVSEGDILFGSFIDGLPRVCVLPKLNTAAIAKADCFCLRPSDDVDRKFLAYQLGTQTVRDALIEQIHGATRPRITTKQLRQLQVVLPPLPEQRRIVEKVESLLARVNAARDRLTKLPTILKRFRQSILAAACSGRLTEDWRRKHPDADASTRLAVLLEERKTLWDCRASARRTTRAPRYKPPFEPGGSVEEIPDSWVTVSVSNLAFLDVGFAFRSSEFAASGVRLLRGENVEPGRLRWLDTSYWPESSVDEFAHLMIEPGEIILALDRPLVSAGLKIARATEDDVPCLLVQRVMRFKMVDSYDSPYLYLCLRDPRFVEFLAHDGTTGSDLPHITGTGVAEFPIPLPSVEEQSEIVRRVHSLLELADAIEARATASTRHSDRLYQSVLSKAFTGELVTATI